MKRKFSFASLCACLMTMAIAISIYAGNGQGEVGIVCDSGTWGLCFSPPEEEENNPSSVPKNYCHWTGMEKDYCVPPDLQ